MTNIQEKAKQALSAYADAVAKLDLITAERDTLINQQIPVEVKAAIAEIEEEYEGAIAQAQEQAATAKAAAEKAALAACIEANGTVRGNGATAAYTPPKPKWNLEALDGYLIAEPALAAFRTESDPKVSIRLVSRK